ncbi:hypothetical protein AB6A23_20190 [Paenibacillus tarimensis]
MICFAILAHEDEEVLIAQIENVRRYNPDSKIVVYNGGENPDFARSLDVPICPYSRPIAYGNLTPFFLDVMRWLEETNADYEFLVNLDHDMLFIKPGFEQFLQAMMQGYDVMGPHFQIHNTPYDYPDYGPGITMWTEWHRWRTFFGADYLARYFNPGQVFRRQIVKRLISALDIGEVEEIWSSAYVFALEEMLFVTAAMQSGAKCRDYPWDFDESLQFVRHLGNVTNDEISKAQALKHYYWIHPVKGDSLRETDRWLLGSGSGSENEG